MKLSIEVWLKTRVVTKQAFICSCTLFRLDPPQWKVSEMNKIMLLSDKEKPESASPPAAVCQFWLSELREQMLPKEDISPCSSAEQRFCIPHFLLATGFQGCSSDVICLHQKHVGCISNILPALWGGCTSCFERISVALPVAALLQPCNEQPPENLTRWASS